MSIQLDNSFVAPIFVVNIANALLNGTCGSPPRDRVQKTIATFESGLIEVSIL